MADEDEPKSKDTSMDIDDDTFAKRRRNLIISVGVSALLVYDRNIHNISSMGIDIDFGEKGSLAIANIILMYTFVRFHQSEKWKKNVRNFLKKWSERTIEKGEKIARIIAENILANLIKENPVKFNPMIIPGIGPAAPATTLKIPAPYVIVPSPLERIGNDKTGVAGLQYLARIGRKYNNRIDDQNAETILVDLSRKQAFITRMSSYFETIAMDNSYMEYEMPRQLGFAMMLLCWVKLLYIGFHPIITV